MKKPLKNPSLVERVILLIESARQKVATAANLAQVYTNYEIGRQIVEEEQQGKSRAGYGEKIIAELSAKLTARFGRGWGTSTLEYMRRFYLVYSSAEISQTEFGKFGKENPQTHLGNSANAVCEIREFTPRFTLSWSHYLLLMRIKDSVERVFYEREATDGGWSFKDLDRQISSSMFERLEVAKDKKKVRALMSRPAPKPETAEEPMKDPYVLEFRQRTLFAASSSKTRRHLRSGSVSRW